MKKLKTDIRNLKIEDLEFFFKKHNSPKFRAHQVLDWIWKHHELDFNKMTNLGLSDRKLLEKNFSIDQLHVIKEKTSLDGTVKFLFELENGKAVEGVLIPQLKRLTACISSQVGCSLACKFCATGKLKLYRNLTAGEIYDQVFLINEYTIKKFSTPITNIVFMGMGEPLLNFKNVLTSIRYITDPNGMGMSGNRITVSTVGITKIIRKIADMTPNFNLAISLHSANEQVRNSIMDINKTNNLNDLKKALEYFYQKTKIKPTYEYVLLKGINDSIQDAKKLVEFCRKIPSKVNLIEYNKVVNIPYEKSEAKTTQLFIDILEKHNILVKFRRSRGEDIGAACGQLATQNK